MVRPPGLENIDPDSARGRIAQFIEHVKFSRFITIVILVNAVTLGLETDPRITNHIGELLFWIDHAALMIFVVEIMLKLFAYRSAFFRDGWNIFDFIIVGISLVPAVGSFSVLRSLRILRVLRLVSIVPQMRRVVSALLHALPGMASIIGVLLLIFYVSAVMVTKLFGLPSEDPSMQALFGSIGASMYTLFQIMTLEGWSQEVVRPAMSVYPMAWLFFIPFIIITSFSVLNLFIGIIVDSMDSVRNRGEKGELNSILTLHEELDAIRRDMAEIKETLKQKDKNRDL